MTLTNPNRSSTVVWLVFAFSLLAACGQDSATTVDGTPASGGDGDGVATSGSGGTTASAIGDGDGDGWGGDGDPGDGDGASGDGDGAFDGANTNIAFSGSQDFGYFRRLVDSGVVAPGAVEARARQLAGEDVPDPAAVEENKPSYERGGAGSLREIDAAPAFEVGQAVRARSTRVSGHTRLPGYVRGHQGTVVALRPTAVLPDATAHFTGEDAQHVYTVEFDSTELWGPDAEASTLRIDLFEIYLEMAS